MSEYAGATMSPRRTLSAIDGELRSILTLQLDAAQQLESVRRQQNDLALHEYNLVCAVEARRGKIDRLLDERLGMRSE